MNLCNATIIFRLILVLVNMTGYFNESKIYIVSKMYTTLFGYAFLNAFYLIFFLH
jgi:hypothetical protein